ncbi:GntR family transcriptional regulator [Oceanospirillum beijerinckii]|uniref:GntR family transcriptional regulator n=1 Tax=Oceanospirillum beijerinckii TaxID=64976 RepID=UPI000418E1BA|nr:GntR family transcriptional regulator [Oceanospirillum beijerinckii]
MSKTAITALQQKLASQIIHWIRSEHLSAGYRLKEAELAQRLGVSRTPIRAALLYLQEHQLVRSLPYRGFELLVDSSELTEPEKNTEQPPVEEKVYLRVLVDLFFQELTESFSEKEFQLHYQLSRHSGRNLLQQLENDGLLSRGQGYKWQVNPSLNSLQHHYESYRCRLMFEPAALLEPQWQLNRSALKQLQSRHQAIIEQNNPIPAKILFQLSADFHEQLIACSGNRFLLQMMQQHNRLRKATDLISMQFKSSPVKACQRRLNIINSLLIGDNKDAAKQLTALLENDIRVMQDSYRQATETPKAQLKHWLQQALDE